MAERDAPRDDAERAAQHLGAMAQPVLLHLPRSAVSRKTEWGLTRAGLPYATLEVAVRQVPLVRRASPVERTAPVLAAGTHLIHGGHAILRWADDHRVTATPSFYPDADLRDVMEWESWADTALGPVAARATARTLARRPTAYARTAWGRLRMRLARPALRAAARSLDADARASQDDEALPQLAREAIDRLRRTDTGFLITDHLTAADLATAAYLAPLVRIGDRFQLDLLDGWGELVQFVRTVRPPRLARTAARRVKESDWRALETLVRAQATLHRPLAGEG